MPLLANGHLQPMDLSDPSVSIDGGGGSGTVSVMVTDSPASASGTSLKDGGLSFASIAGYASRKGKWPDACNMCHSPYDLDDVSNAVFKPTLATSANTNTAQFYEIFCGSYHTSR